MSNILLINSNDFNFPFKEFIVTFLTFLFGYLLWKVQYQKGRIKDIENQLSERKYKLYSELIYIIFDIVNNGKAKKPLSEEDLQLRFSNVKRDMFLYASDEIFRAFTEWTLSLDNLGHFKKYYKVLKLIRIDMGQLSTKIELDDFMLFLMQDREAYNEFKKQANW